jgi:phosphoribosyl-AMP cyclohydrolase
MSENLKKTVSDQIKFDDKGLVPAIAQQFDTGEILMMAWMNADSLAESLKTGQACYWSRSRQKLWRKGESSGHVQTIKGFRLDCDGDTILLQVDQKGVACHTGRHNCFFTSFTADSLTEIAPVVVDPETIYGDKGAK